jgi:uncharacterized protein with FMN-binding domain
VSVLLLAVGSPSFAEDVVELHSGARVRGKVLEQTAESITVSIKIGSRELTRKYPRSGVRAISIDGQRQELSPAAETKSAGKTGQAKDQLPKRTRAEVNALIDQVGRTPPEWFEETPLNFPETLDLAWPHPPEGPWNNKKNVGQFVWDVVNPNPGRWREGVRLMHHLLVKHQANPEIRERAMLALARMYHNLLEDYGRAAFWCRAIGSEKKPQEYSQTAVLLAECYWRLGNREMAVELLTKTPTTLAAAKLWADLGETNRAVKIAEAYRSSSVADEGWLVAGDACRTAGRYDEAIKHYQRVLDMPVGKEREQRIERSRTRAKASIEAIRLFDTLNLAKIPDGSYRASSMGYEGPVHVEVKVAGNRIADVEVVQHKEKQFYSAMTDTPQKIIAKQGVRGVDATSAATITSEAIINATAKALAGGQKK